MGRLLRCGLLAATLLWFLPIPAAHAQQYEDESGPLELEITITVTVALSGDGFVRDSVVYVTLVPVEGDDGIDLGTIPTDDQGRFFGELTLLDTLDEGEYSILATGVTSQGATRVLTTQIVIGASDIALVEPDATTTTLTVSEISATTSTVTAGDGQTHSIQLIASSASDTDNPFDRTLLVRILMAGLVALGGVWWWLYRAVKS